MKKRSPPGPPPDSLNDVTRSPLTTRTSVMSCRLPAASSIPRSPEGRSHTLTIHATSSAELARAVACIHEMLSLDPAMSVQGIQGDGWDVS